MPIDRWPTGKEGRGKGGREERRADGGVIRGGVIHMSLSPAFIHLSVRLSLARANVCVCVCERERESVCVCVCVCSRPLAAVARELDRSLKSIPLRTNVCTLTHT